MWLEKQPDAKLRNWLQRTKTPMIAALPEGEILWCNHSFEELLGWSSVELIGKMTWMELTANKEELEADQELVQQTVDGRRTDYQIHKAYRTKDGGPKRIIVDVLRYPQHNEFECFLISVFPVDRGEEFALGQLTSIRSLILELLDREPEGITADKVSDFVKAHPIASSIIAVVFGTLLFGERVVEVIQLFGIGNGTP